MNTIWFLYKLVLTRYVSDATVANTFVQVSKHTRQQFHQNKKGNIFALVVKQIFSELSVLKDCVQSLKRVCVRAHVFHWLAQRLRTKWCVLYTGERDKWTNTLEHTDVLYMCFYMGERYLPLLFLTYTRPYIYRNCCLGCVCVSRSYLTTLPTLIMISKQTLDVSAMNGNSTWNADTQVVVLFLPGIYVIC